MGKRKLTEVVAQSKPRTETVRLCLRGDLLARHEQLEQDLARARELDEATNEPDTAPAIAREIKALEAEIREAEVPFVFESIGQSAWSDLLAEHPPTKEEREAGLDHHPDTFCIEAVARSMVDPDPGEGDAALEAVMSMFGPPMRLNQTQFIQLWTGCYKANMGGGKAPGESSAASAVLRLSEQSSTTAAHAASLAAPSSAG